MSFRAVLERYRVNPRCSKKELAIASASSIQFSISVVGVSVVSLNCHYFGNTPMIVPPMSPRQLCLPHRRRPVPMARWIPAFAGKTRIVTRLC